MCSWITVDLVITTNAENNIIRTVTVKHNIHLFNYVITGVKRTNLVYQKQSGHWIERPVYVATTQRFRHELMEEVIERRMDPTIRYKDPSSRIRVPVLAANIGLPKPSKEDVRKGRTSRFKAKDKRP